MTTGLTLGQEIRRAAALKRAAEDELKVLCAYAVRQGASLTEVGHCAGVGYATIKRWALPTPEDQTGVLGEIYVRTEAFNGLAGVGSTDQTSTLRGSHGGAAVHE